MKNWIFARVITSHEWVKVRQLKGVLWIDEKDKKYDVCELDFTQKYLEPDVLNIEEFNRHNEEINQKYQESQALYMEMLSKMDANSIADHKAKIDEREYWRKLRGDIFMSMLEGDGTPEQCLEMTEMYFSRLYKQDQEFFKDK